MRIVADNKPVKFYLLFFIFEAVCFGLGFLSYYLFKEDPSAPFIGTAVFFFFQSLALLILILLNKQFFVLGLKLKLYKDNGIVAFLLNASRQLHIYVGPYNYKFRFQTKKDKGPEFQLRLGTARVSWGGLPVHLGLDSSFTSVDIENVAHQQLINSVYNGDKIKAELKTALENSKSPYAEKLLEKDEKSDRLREKVFSFDLNSIFPLQTMHYEYAGELIAAHETGKNIRIMRAFLDAVKQNKIFFPMIFMILLMLGSVVFSYQAMQNTTSLSETLDGIAKASSQGFKAIQDTVQNVANEVVQNQDLIPKKVVVSPGGE